MDTETQEVRTGDTVRVTVNVDRVANSAAVAGTKKDARGIKGKFPHYIGLRKSSVEGQVSNPAGVRALQGRIIARPPSYKHGESSPWATQLTWMPSRRLRQFYNVNTETSGSSFWIGLKESRADGGFTWAQCGLRWIQNEQSTRGSLPLAYLETGALLPSLLGGDAVYNRTLAAPAFEAQNDGGGLQWPKQPLQGWENAPLILDFVMYKLPSETDANGADSSERPWRVIFKDARAGKSAAAQSNYFAMDLSAPLPTGSVGVQTRTALQNAYKAQKMKELDLQFETNQSVSFVPGTAANPAEMKNIQYAVGLASGISVDSRPNDFNDLVAYYNWATTSFSWQQVVFNSNEINRQIRTGRSTTNGGAETITQHPWWDVQVQGGGVKWTDKRAWGFGRIKD